MEVCKLTPAVLAAAAARFEAALRDPERAQRELLLQILRRNAASAYGRARGFAGVDSVDAYRARVPAVDYEPLRALHERACAGEPDVLFAGPPLFEAQTSGTKDGRAKVFAYSAEVAGEYHHYVGPALAAMERDHPGTIDHTLRLTAPGWTRNAAGILSGFASGFASHVLAGLPTACGVPDEILAADFEARYYGVLRLGLQAPVRCLSVITPGVLLTLFRRAHQYGEELARDLEAGTISAGPALDARAQGAAVPLLRADPAAADRLRRSLRDRGRFVPGDVWPELRVIQAWKGGATGHDLEAIAEVCPGIPIRPQNSGTTEAALLVPLADAWTGGVPALLSTVFEFFPADEDPARAAFVPIPELRAGQGYRALVTSERGVYRYALDDVFFVEGVHRGVPVLRYSHRLGLTSSVAGEKLIEVQVAEAARLAAAETGLPLGDFELVPEQGRPYRYLLFAELPLDAAEGELRGFLRAFEDALHRQNPDYDLYRANGSLAPPELAQLAPGELERRRRQLADRTRRSDAQLKTPRLRAEPIASRAGLPALRWITLTRDAR